MGEVERRGYMNAREEGGGRKVGEVGRGYMDVREEGGAVGRWER